MKTILKTLLVLFILSACTSGKKETANTETGENAVAAESDVIIEEDIWLIDEHQVNDIPVTSKAASAKKPDVDNTQADEAQEVEEEMDQEIDLEEWYEIATMEEMEASLAEQEYEAMQTVQLTELAIPIEETQTVVSYTKKGKAKAAFQVVSSPVDNEVEQIIFTDKKHKDVYDVQAGMSCKEVKRLRKELKHMVKKGQVFLYSDESNIMYLTDIQDVEGDGISASDVESSEVQAIIWKDKKHHKKK